MRIVIPCAGDGTRWGDAHGVPKHLARLCGEPILHRTIRQILEVEPAAEIRVITHTGRDPRYRIAGTHQAKARLDPGREQADKVLSSEHMWSSDHRTLVLFGDVFWTDEAILAALTNRDPWTVFARFGASAITGNPHAELFGFGFDPDHHQLIRDAAHRCVRLAKAGTLTNWSGGWQVYKAAAGVPDDQIIGVPDDQYRARNLGHSVSIDDWTDDLDAPSDWDRWCLRYALAKKSGDPVPAGGR